MTKRANDTVWIGEFWLGGNRWIPLVYLCVHNTKQQAQKAVARMNSAGLSKYRVAKYRRVGK